MGYSRKKIRGFKRKLKQLEHWKEFIISYDFNNIPNSGIIFRMNFNPFIWYKDQEPNPKFHPFIFKAMYAVIQALKKNKTILQNNLTIKLWLFNPRIIKSLVKVAPVEHYELRNKQIKASETDQIPPELIRQIFNGFKINKGNDNAFEELETANMEVKWKTIRLGDIWTIK